MDPPPDKYPLQFQMPSFLQDHMIFPSHAEQAQKYYPLQHVHMSHRPFEFDSPPPQHHHQQGQQQSQSQSHHSHAFVESAHRALTAPFSTLSQPSLDLMYSHGLIPTSLPLYSASGFDMLGILAKVATRPNPRIMLGPVDMTCSFVVSDIRSGDAPIVYASPTFCRLTGYTEAEVLGRNCRFLQSPTGSLQRGDPRLHTAPDAVRQLYRSIIQENECQASLINYRKDGAAFVNLVTLIPVCADSDAAGTVTHFVGFQVDLDEQPSAIMQKMRDGNYFVNYSTANMGRCGTGAFGGSASRKGRGVSTELIEMLRRAAAATSTEGSVTGASPSNTTPALREQSRADVQSFVLENTDDFIHVLSLKGSLLYVAPAITRVLGYTSTELLGRSITDLCHPADLVPVMRELKDASSTNATTTTPAAASQRPPRSNTPPSSASSTIEALYASSGAFRFSPHHPPLYPAVHPRHPHIVPNAPHLRSHQLPPFTIPQPPQPTPRPITSLLFRARHKSGHYVWLLSRGSLHVEPGKGRKAVVMVGRVVQNAVVEGLMERGLLSEGGGSEDPLKEGEPKAEWGIVAPNGIILSGGESLAFPSGARSPKEAVVVAATAANPTNPAIGRTLASFVSSEVGARRVGEVLADAACAEEAGVKKVRCILNGSGEEVEVRFYAVGRQAQQANDESVTTGSMKLPAGVVFEVARTKEGGDERERRSGSADVQSQQQQQQQSVTVASFAVSPNPANLSSATNYMQALAQTQLQGQNASASAVPYSTSRNVAISGATSYSPTYQTSTLTQPTFPSQSHIHARTLPHLSIPSQSVQSSPSSTSSPSNAGTPLSMTMSTSPPQLHSASLTSHNHYSTSTPPDSALSLPQHLQSHPPPPLSLSRFAETSWQYELTRLKFENEKLRAEAARLERKGRRRGHGAPPSGFLGPENSNPQATVEIGMKRPREE